VGLTAGQMIHKGLEKELHETVTFEQITTREDLWATKLLNILFGIRELELQEMTVPSSLSDANSSGNVPFSG
jgi:Exonuclease V - a 5' deoxyribonuclease